MSRVCIGWRNQFFILFFGVCPEIPVQEALMTEVTLQLDNAVALFYGRIAVSAGKPLEQVLSDALFKLAGELSLNALRAENEKFKIDNSK